ncbi:MAG: hypothetical protein WC222_08725 [Parachlamydiales bacterium]|jgi:hypothetical protein
MTTPPASPATSPRQIDQAYFPYAATESSPLFEDKDISLPPASQETILSFLPSDEWLKNASPMDMEVFWQNFFTNIHYTSFAFPLDTQELELLSKHIHSNIPLLQAIAGKLLLEFLCIEKSDAECELLFTVVPKLVYNVYFSQQKTWFTRVHSLLELDTTEHAPPHSTPTFCVHWLTLLQKSKQLSAQKAFKTLLNLFVKTEYQRELFLEAPQWGKEATVYLLRLLNRLIICDSALLSHYWNSYTLTNSAFSLALIEWTLIHPALPQCILGNLPTVKTLPFHNGIMKLFTDLWEQRRSYPPEGREMLCKKYISHLLSKGEFSSARYIFLEGKKILGPESLNEYLGLIEKSLKDNKKAPLEKGIHWLAPLKQKFHDALDTNNYEHAITALRNLKRLLHSGDKRLHLPVLFHTLLKQISRESNIETKQAAIAQFEGLLLTSKDMEIWMARPDLFIPRALLFLELTNVATQNVFIDVVCKIQFTTRYPHIRELIIPLLHYLCRQKEWPEKVVPLLTKWLQFNLLTIKEYLSNANTDKYLHYSLASLLLSSKCSVNLLDLCLSEVFKPEFIKDNPQKIEFLLTLLIDTKELENVLHDSSDLLFDPLTVLSSSQATYPYAKHFISSILNVNDNALHQKPEMIRGYIGIIDHLIGWDLDLAIKCLEKLSKSHSPDISIKYKNCLEKMLSLGQFETALGFCSTYNQVLNDSVLVPHVTEKLIEAPSAEVEKFLVRHRAAIDPKLWVKYCLYLFRLHKTYIVQEYIHQFISALSKITASESDFHTILQDTKVKDNLITLSLICIRTVKDKKVRSELSGQAFKIVIACYDLKNDEHRQIVLEVQQVTFLLNSQPKLKAFRKQICGLPDFDEEQEVSKVCSLPFPDDILSIFFRCEYLVSFAIRTHDVLGLLVFLPLSKLLLKLTSKNIDKDSDRFKKLIEGIATINKEYLPFLNLTDILDGVLKSKCNVVRSSFSSWLNIGFIQGRDQFILTLLNNFIDYTDNVLPHHTWVDNHVREHLSNESFTEAERSNFFLVLLHSKNNKIKANQLELTNGISLLLPFQDEFPRIELLFNIFTTYFHLVQHTEKLCQLLPSIFSYVSYAIIKGDSAFSAHLMENLEKFLSKIHTYNHTPELLFEIRSHIAHQFFFNLDASLSSPSKKNMEFLERILHSIHLSTPKLSAEQVQAHYKLLLYMEMTSSHKEITTAVKKHLALFVLKYCKNMDLSDAHREVEVRIVDSIRCLCSEIEDKIDSNSIDKITILIATLRKCCINKKTDFRKKIFIDFVLLMEQLLRKLQCKAVKDSTLYLREHTFALHMKIFSITDDPLIERGPLDSEVADHHALLKVETFNSFFYMPLRPMTTKELQVHYSRLYDDLVILFEMRMEREHSTNEVLKKKFEDAHVYSKVISHCFERLKICNSTPAVDAHCAIILLEKLLILVKKYTLLKDLFQKEIVIIKESMALFFNKSQSLMKISRYSQYLNEIQTHYAELFIG